MNTAFDRQALRFLRQALCVGVLFILAGAFSSCKTEGAPGSDAIAEYHTFLNGLPRDGPNSIQTATAYFQQHFVNKSQRQRDAAFLAFRNFYYPAVKSADVLIDRKKWQEVENDWKKQEFLQWLGDNGLALCSSEGNYFIDESYSFLLCTFGRYVSKPLRDYLALRQVEMRRRYVEDAALRISFLEVAKRCVAWERYLREYPRSSLRSDAEYRYRDYLAILLEGMNKNCILDEWSEDPKKWQRGIEEAYEYIIKDYGETRPGQLIAAYYSLVKRSGFKKTPEVEQFLKDHKSEYTRERTRSSYPDFGYIVAPESCGPPTPYEMR